MATSAGHIGAGHIEVSHQLAILECHISWPYWSVTSAGHIGVSLVYMSFYCALLVIQSEILIYFLTAKSFVELAQCLLKQLGVNFVLSAKLSQDWLESFFSKQRIRGG